MDLSNTSSNLSFAQFLWKTGKLASLGYLVAILSISCATGGEDASTLGSKRVDAVFEPFEKWGFTFDRCSDQSGNGTQYRCDTTTVRESLYSCPNVDIGHEFDGVTINNTELKCKAVVPDVIQGPIIFPVTCRGTSPDLTARFTGWLVCEPK